VIDASDLHPTKHLEPITSTDAGITISINSVPQNTSLAIRDNLDPDSNVTAVSDLHSKKHLSLNTSTDAGITISINPLS
jgi:hypothetical protein